MSAFASLFGSTLVKPNKETVNTEEALAGKTAVAVYFSAHWCPPCRGFTPKLAEWYKKDLQAKGMEVVFASSDRDEAAFDDYFTNEMPWLAIPYAEREIKNKLSKKFKVSGIPSLVILKNDGSVITLDGRSAVSSDPTGEEFPWIPKPFKEVFGDKFQNKEKEIKPIADTVEYIGIYFSAHWCPPCRNFTPSLVETYNKVNKETKKWEIVFVSADRDEKSFDDYYGSMPWMTLPYTEKKRNDAISNHFDVSGIPCLVILNAKDLSVVSKNAVGAVRGGQEFPYLPPLYSDIDANPAGIDEGLSFVMLQEDVKDDAERKKYEDVLKEVAKKYKKVTNSDKEQEDVMFYCASKKGRLADRVRSECGLSPCSDDEKEGKKEPTVVVMNIPEESYYTFQGEFNVDNVGKFFESYMNNQLESKNMGA